MLWENKGKEAGSFLEEAEVEMGLCGWVGRKSTGRYGEKGTPGRQSTFWRDGLGSGSLSLFSGIGPWGREFVREGETEYFWGREERKLPRERDWRCRYKCSPVPKMNERTGLGAGGGVSPGQEAGAGGVWIIMMKRSFRSNRKTSSSHQHVIMIF